MTEDSVKEAARGLKPSLEDWPGDEFGEAGTSPVPAGSQKALEPRCERGLDKSSLIHSLYDFAGDRQPC